jgi:hypothetical protein
LPCSLALLDGTIYLKFSTSKHYRDKQQTLDRK